MIFGKRKILNFFAEFEEVIHKFFHKNKFRKFEGAWL
jgi:hypothetical protein